MLSHLPRNLPVFSAPLQIARRSAVTVTSTRTNASAPLLANIEASWKDLATEEQYQVYQQLGELQKKDWKELSLDEKKAGEFGVSSFPKRKERVLSMGESRFGNALGDGYAKSWSLH